MANVRFEWEKHLDEELAALEPVPRLIRYSEVIMYLIRDLAARLSDERRELVITIKEQSGVDNTQLAEMIGSRRNTVARLATEGAARRRERVDGVPLP